MNKLVKFASVGLIVAVVALTGATAALAQTPTPPGNGSGILAEYSDLVHAPIAQALGLTLDEFEAAVASGKTAFQIAQEKGVDFATVQAAMQAGREAALKQAVADGALTQEQADWMLSHQMGMGRAGGMNGRSMAGRGGRMTLAPALRSGASAGVGGFSGYNGTCPFTTIP